MLRCSCSAARAPPPANARACFAQHATNYPPLFMRRCGGGFEAPHLYWRQGKQHSEPRSYLPVIRRNHAHKAAGPQRFRRDHIAARDLGCFTCRLPVAFEHPREVGTNPAWDSHTPASRFLATAESDQFCELTRVPCPSIKIILLWQ